jgi:hypothetical protein
MQMNVSNKGVDQDGQVSLEGLKSVVFQGHAGWDVKNLPAEKLCELLTNSATLEYYVEGEERVVIEKLEGRVKATVVTAILKKYAFWDPDFGFNCSCSAHVTTANRALIPDGLMNYDPLRKLTVQQAAHALQVGAPLPHWVAEVEFGYLVHKPLMGYDKVRNHLMPMVGGPDETGQPTCIDEAWLFVVYQMKPGEEELPAADNYPQGAPLIVPTNGPLPLPTRDHPAYLVIFSRNPPGARPTSPLLAAEQYYQLDPNTLFMPPPTSVAHFGSPVYANLPVPRVPGNAAAPAPANVPPVMIPAPPNVPTPAISVNSLLKSMQIMAFGY